MVEWGVVKRLEDKQRGSLGSRLIELRTALNLSQKEMAKAIGITVDAYGRWERGGTQIPKQKLLAKAARKLGVSPTYLLTGEESLTRDEISELRADVARLSEQLDALISGQAPARKS